MPASYPVGLIRTPGEPLALSSTVASLGIPPNAYQALLYNPSTDFRLHLNPAILAVVFYDVSNSAGARYEQSSGSGVSLRNDLTDRDTATGTGTAMDAMATGDFLYVCTSDIVGGFRVVIGSANGEAATVAATYRKNDDTWAALTETDGTTAGGASLGQTGSITWTAPTDAKRAVLGGSSGIFTDADAPPIEGFWWRFAFDIALGADVEIDELWTLNKDTSRGYFRAATEYAVSFDRRTIGAIEAALAVGTDTLQITWMRVAGGGPW